MQSLINLENMDTSVTMKQLKLLQSLYESARLQRVAADILRPNVNIKEI